MIWSLLEAQKNVHAGFHMLPSSQEQVAAAFKRQEAANTQLFSAPPLQRSPTSATTVLKGESSFCYYISMESPWGAYQLMDASWNVSFFS